MNDMGLALINLGNLIISSFEKILYIIDQKSEQISNKIQFNKWIT